ncbi:hypothetical protein [Thiobacillus denitrificans]|uniref:hypothetical protein n=1 Tax=Thiobacillus denitrificans TaxID=36861 RepID=UPI001930E230|nr:hypothetical protein [Thiobacillus denitrificans]
MKSAPHTAVNRDAQNSRLRQLFGCPLPSTLGSKMILPTSRTVWFAFASFTLYFGAFLVQKVVPSFGGTAFVFLLTLSLLIVVPILVLLAVWGTVALARERLRKQPMSARSRAAGRIAFAGIAACAISLVLGSLLPNSLPSGSYYRTFDRGASLDPASASYVKGDIAPRQKMLADVVGQLPGKSRYALEVMLGPSLDTSYFKDSGRDLIYITGPQRDSLFAIDSEWLLIWVDDKGIYERHAIVTD